MGDRGKWEKGGGVGERKRDEVERRRGEGDGEKGNGRREIERGMG